MIRIRILLMSFDKKSNVFYYFPKKQVHHGDGPVTSFGKE
jgi:hypothetical protein